MTDTSPAPTAVPQPLWDAIRDLDLPKRHLRDLTAHPEEAGEILLEAVDVLRGRDERAARALAQALREHAPKAGHRQFATNQIVTMLRAEGRTDEADALLDELMDSGPDRGVAVLLAEDLASRGDYAKALHCYNVVCRGMLAQPPETVAELNRLGLMPLLGRARMREALGMAPDAHDLATRSTDAYLPPLDARTDLGGAPNRSVDTTPRPGRNDPCSCGSGRKFKKCCDSPLAR